MRLRRAAFTSVIDSWDHNAHYHADLLRAVPRPCALALDVGCGTGRFARALAGLADRVDAIDRAPEVVACARECAAGPANVRFAVAEFLSWPGDGTYDFVSMVASLHHMPMRAGLTRARALLRPGGVLAVLGLDRARSPLHAVVRSAVAYPISVAHRLWHAGAAANRPVPLRDPDMTLADVRREAREIVPGAAIVSCRLWRYTLIWNKR